MFHTFNYWVNFLIWAGIGCGLYRFWKPMWRKNAWARLISGFILAVVLTLATVAVADKHPIFLQKIPTRSWWRIPTQFTSNILLREDKGIDITYGVGGGELWRGWPIGFISRKWCGIGLKTEWEKKTCGVTINVFKPEDIKRFNTLYFLEPQGLLFDCIFWFVVSLSFFRIRHLK